VSIPNLDREWFDDLRVSAPPREFNDVFAGFSAGGAIGQGARQPVDFAPVAGGVRPVEIHGVLGMSMIELNKIVGAILLGGFVLLVSSILAKNLVQPMRHEAVAMVAHGEGGGEAPAQPAGDTLEPVSPLLANADLAAGETAFKKCTQCHTIEKGATAKKLGPNLWGVVGAPHGHVEGFNYSEALKGKPGNWDYEALNAWLHSPKTYAPGTKMTFAGIKKTEERANLIAWLRTKSDSPPPLPDAAAIEATQQQAAGEQAPPAETAATTEPTTATPPATEQPAAGTTEQQAPADTGQQTAATPPGGGIADLLKSADPAAGAKVAAKCKACHGFDKGGPNKVGPNLWDIVGAKQAHLGDAFKYSDALKGLGGEWTYDALDKFLTAPKEYVPGTKMVFPGLKKPEDRAAVIAYLRSLSDSPKPLP
jgi:cytochrome c